MIVGVAIAKRSLPCEKFVYQNSEAVVVELIGVTFGLVDFWRHGMNSATNSECSVFIDLFGKAEVDHGHPSLFIDYEIGGLDVTIDIPILMEFMQNEADLSNYEEGESRVQPFNHFKQFM